MSIVYPLMVIALPWAVSLLTPRAGWSEGGPSAGNLLGLVPVAAGIVGDKLVEQPNVAADHVSVPGCEAEFHMLLPLF